MSRDANGQFAKGNPGGPGRPPRTTEADYLAALTEIVTLEDWRQIVERAVADAKIGDKSARDWLSRYTIGDSLPANQGAGEERIITIVHDPDFFGNADKVAAANDPVAMAERKAQLDDFIETQVRPAMQQFSLRLEAEQG